jgi:hypothetical protein
VGERWGHNYDLIGGNASEVWYRAAQNCEAMIASGVDPLRLVCEHTHRRGMAFLGHLLLGLVHTPPSRVTNGRAADFTVNNPQWALGQDPTGALFGNAGQLSYGHLEVRANRLAVVKEVLEDYPTDGIELNFSNIGGGCLLRRAEVAVHTGTLTGWLREIRVAADAAATAQGRAKRVVVRVPASLRLNAQIGHDVLAWVRDGSVDMVVATPVECPDYSSSVSELRTLVEGCAAHGVPVVAALESAAIEQTAEVHRAATANAYAAGVGGVLFWRWYPEHRWPYTPMDYDRLRHAAYPDVLARKDKTFRLGPVSLAGTPVSGIMPWSAMVDYTPELPPMPVAIRVGGGCPPLQLDIHDNIAAAAADGRLWRCELVVSLAALHHTDEVRLEWNGRPVPAAAIRKADWIFQMRPSGVPTTTPNALGVVPQPVAGFRGYRLHVDLAREGLLPGHGANAVAVHLLTRDPRLHHAEPGALPVEVYDVQVAVEYLRHRNGIRDAEDFYRA